MRQTRSPVQLFWVPVISSRVLMEQARRFRVALVIYAVLATLVWTTMDNTSVPIAGGEVSLRGLTLAILALFAVRTVLHWRAQQIRERKEQQ